MSKSTWEKLELELWACDWQGDPLTIWTTVSHLIKILLSLRNVLLQRLTLCLKLHNGLSILFCIMSSAFGRLISVIFHYHYELLNHQTVNLAHWIRRDIWLTLSICTYLFAFEWTTLQMSPSSHVTEWWIFTQLEISWDLKLHIPHKYGPFTINQSHIHYVY